MNLQKILTKDKEFQKNFDELDKLYPTEEPPVAKRVMKMKAKVKGKVLPA